MIVVNCHLFFSSEFELFFFGLLNKLVSRIDYNNIQSVRDKFYIQTESCMTYSIFV